MPKKFTHEEYLKMLPKKQVGTAVILLNSKEELLIVKPDYKECWLVPGGTTNEKESPLKCALRETKEEIGLDVSEIRLVGVYHHTKEGPYADFLKFIFYGGILDENQISQIKLQTEELEEYIFKSLEEALPLLSPSLQKSIPACLKAIRENSFAYLDA